jgi:osmotically-inducible protein OsmY
MARNEERWREERERRRWARGDWSGGEGPAAAPSSPYGEEWRNPGFYSPGQVGYGADYRAGYGFGGDVGFARREGGYAGAGGYGYQEEPGRASGWGGRSGWGDSPEAKHETNYTDRWSGAYPPVESALRGGGYDHWDLYHGRKPVRGAFRGSGYRRDFLDRAGDEVASWFGDDEAEYRRRMDAEREGYRGRGPRNYTRSDDRIREDVSDRLTDDPWLDASEIEVSVSNGEVTLNGTVTNRYDRRRAEDCAEGVSGVRYVQNNLRARPAEGVDTAADIARRTI